MHLQSPMLLPFTFCSLSYISFVGLFLNSLSYLILSSVLFSFLLISYLIFSHIYRLYTDYMGWTLDFTGPQMLLTLKLTSIGWNYFDGTANKNVTEKQKASAITKLPTLLELYLFFPSSFFLCFLLSPFFSSLPLAGTA